MADEGSGAAAQQSGESGEGTQQEEQTQSEKVFTQEQVEKLVTDRLARERKKISREMETRLLVDEAFREKALAEWDVKPAAEGQNEDLDDRLKKLRAEWTAKHVNPLEKKIETLEQQIGNLNSENGQLLRSGLERDLISSLAGKVRQSLLAPPEGGHAPILNFFNSEQFVWDAETKDWRVSDGNGGFKLSTGGKHTYMTPAEFVEVSFLQDPNNAWAVLDTTQEGSGSKGPGGGTDTSGRRIYRESEWLETLRNPKDEQEHADAQRAMGEGRVRPDA